MEEKRSSYAIIPCYVMDDERLHEGAKMLYARISMYSQEGRCWASNSHLAEKHHVDVRTIQRWLKELTDAGYIEIDIEKGSFQTKRNIWITSDFKKMYTKRQPCHVDMTTMSPPPDANVMHINTSNINIKDNNTNTPAAPKAPVCVFSSFGKHIKLKQEDYDQFCKEHGKEAIDSLIIEMNDWISAKGRPYKDYSAAIRTWLRKEKITQPRASKGTTIEDNKKHAKEISKIYQSTFYKIEALTKQVEFTTLGANGQTYVIKYEENGFKDQMENFLRKLEFRKKEKKE